MSNPEERIIDLERENKRLNILIEDLVADKNRLTKTIDHLEEEVVCLEDNMLMEKQKLAEAINKEWISTSEIRNMSVEFLESNNPQHRTVGRVLEVTLDVLEDYSRS